MRELERVRRAAGRAIVDAWGQAYKVNSVIHVSGLVNKVVPVTDSQMDSDMKTRQEETDRQKIDPNMETRLEGQHFADVQKNGLPSLQIHMASAEDNNDRASLHSEGGARSRKDTENKQGQESTQEPEKKQESENTPGVDNKLEQHQLPQEQDHSSAYDNCFLSLPRTAHPYDHSFVSPRHTRPLYQNAFVSPGRSTHHVNGEQASTSLRTQFVKAQSSFQSKITNADSISMQGLDTVVQKLLEGHGNARLLYLARKTPKELHDLLVHMCSGNHSNREKEQQKSRGEKIASVWREKATDVIKEL